jgi:hypothetical protein
VDTVLTEFSAFFASVEACCAAACAAVAALWILLRLFDRLLTLDWI